MLHCSAQPTVTENIVREENTEMKDASSPVGVKVKAATETVNVVSVVSGPPRILRSHLELLAIATEHLNGNSYTLVKKKGIFNL